MLATLLTERSRSFPGLAHQWPGLELGQQGVRQSCQEEFPTRIPCVSLLHWPLYAQVPKKGSLAWGVTEERNHTCCSCMWLSVASSQCYAEPWKNPLSSDCRNIESWRCLGEHPTLPLGKPPWLSTLPHAKGPFLWVPTHLLSDPAVWPLTWKWGSPLSHCLEKPPGRSEWGWG
jgi:hypothetical protein